MKVLVVGATGVLGRAVVRRLRASAFDVRVLTRVRERAGSLVELDAEGGGRRPGRSRLDRAGLPGHGPRVRGGALVARPRRYRSEQVDDIGHRTLIDCARAAGVERFVYTSAANASRVHPVDFLRTKAAIEEYLRNSGMPHVILRPTAFMEQHVHAFNGKHVLQKGKAQLIGSGNKKRNSAVQRLLARRLEQSTAPRLHVVDHHQRLVR